MSQSKLQKRARAMQWACEPLEGRTLFATITWTTQGDGNWSTASNWTNLATGAHTVPTSTDAVVIDIPGLNITVTYNASSRLVLNNLVNDEFLDIGGGGVSWTGTTSAPGLWDGAGTVQIDPNTTAVISGTTEILRDGQTLINAGTVTLSTTEPTITPATTPVGGIIGQVGATITNFGTFDVTNDASITYPAGIGDGVFNNAGLFEKTGGTGTTEVGGAQGFTFNDSDNFISPVVPQGDTQVLTGTLDLGDSQNTSLDQGGTFEISAGATLEFDRGTENIVTYTNPITSVLVVPAITGAGTVLIDGGTVQSYGTFAVHELDMEPNPTTPTTSGELLLQENTGALSGSPQLSTSLPPEFPSATVDILHMDAGTLGGDAAGIFPVPDVGPRELPGLVVGTTFSWTGGTFSGTGRLLIDSTVSTSTITTTNPKAITGGFCIDILNETIWQDSGTIDITDDSIIWIQPSGTLWDQGNGDISGNAGTGNIWNAGNFLKEDGTGDTTIDAGITFLNDSAFQGNAAHPLPLFNLAPSPLVAQLDIRTGTVLFVGNLTNNDTVLIHSNSTLTFNGGSTVTNGTDDDLNAPAKILGVDDESTNASEIRPTLNFGDANLTGDTTSRLDVQIVNFGIGIYDFNNTAGGAQVMDTGSFDGNTTGTIGGSGTLEVAPDNQPSGTTVPGAFTWDTGQLNGVGVNTSALLIDQGASLHIVTRTTFDSTTHATMNGYSIINKGTIDFSDIPTAISVLTINGDFTQTSTGTLDSTITEKTILDTGIPALDSLAVSGVVTLAGTLNLTAATGVTLSPTQNFTLINDSLVTLSNGVNIAVVVGTFTGLPEGSTIPLDSLAYAISYVGGDGNDVTLSTLPSITISTPLAVFQPLPTTTTTTTLTFNVSISELVTNAVTVTFTAINGTASDGAFLGIDYVFAPPVTGTGINTSTLAPAGNTGTITFNPTSGSLVFQLVVTIDSTTAIDPTKTFTIALSSPTLGTLGSPSTAVGTLLSQNGAPTFTFDSATYSVSDAIAPVDGATIPDIATLTVDRTGDPLNAVTVDYTTEDGTAVGEVNYVPISGTLSFAANASSATISVTIINDGVFDGSATSNGNLTFDVVLSNPQPTSITPTPVLGTPSTAVVTIVETTPPGISVANTSAVIPPTGTSSLVFTVSVQANPLGETTTVDYTTADGTALAGSDYTATSGTLSFAPGVTTETVTVTLLADALVTANKTMTLNLSNPVNGAITVASGVGTLVNENFPTVSIASTTVTEPLGGQTNAVFTLTLTAAAPQPITLSYNTADGSAIAGTDYVASSGTISLAAGQSSALIDVPIDTTFSSLASENFSVNLSNPVNVLLGTATAIGTINNLPVNTATFSAGHPFKYIGAPNNHITLSLTGPGTGTVDYLGLLINDVKQVTLNGTTPATTFRDSTSMPQAFLVNLFVNGSINSISAPTTSLQGNLDITGAVQKLQLQSVLGDNTLTIGSAVTGISSVAASFANASNATLTSALPFSSLKLTNANGFNISAPSIASLTSTGSFAGSSVTLAGNLGTMRVAKTLSNSTLSIGGNIGTVTAGVMTSDTIFAGVASGVTTLPTSSSQFADTGSTIGQVTAQSTFSSTLIAAPTIGGVSLGKVNPSNNGAAFGIAGNSIKTVVGNNGKLLKLSNALLLTSPFSDGDLSIHLT